MPVVPPTVTTGRGRLSPRDAVIMFFLQEVVNRVLYPTRVTLAHQWVGLRMLRGEIGRGDEPVVWSTSTWWGGSIDAVDLLELERLCGKVDRRHSLVV